MSKKPKKVEKNEILGELPYSDYELAELYEELGELPYSDYELVYGELEEIQGVSPLYNLEKFTDDFKNMTFSELTTSVDFIEEIIEENFLTLLEQIDKLPESHKVDAFNILFKFFNLNRFYNYKLLTDHFLILLKLSQKIMTYDQQCEFLSRLRLLVSDLYIESLVEENLEQIESQIRTIIDNIDEIPESVRYEALAHLNFFVSIEASMMKKSSSSLLKCIDTLSKTEERKIYLRQLLRLRNLKEEVE